MTFTYDLARIDVNQTAQVRLNIGDTNGAEPLVHDEEINLALTQRNSVYGASAMMALAIAAKFSRLSGVSNGASRHDLAQKAENYRKLAKELDARDDQFGGAMPYAGGATVADMQGAAEDTARVQPVFVLGMDDNAAGQANPWGSWP